MEGNHSPFCPLHEQFPQTPFCGAPHSPPWPGTQTQKFTLINACFLHCSLRCQNKTFCASSQIKWFLLNVVHFYPDTEEGADRLVVTCLQLHVTPVFQLVDIVPSPKDSVTPGRHAALPTAGITVLQANRDSHHTQTQHRRLYTSVSMLLTGLQKASMVAKLNKNSKRPVNVAAERLWILHPGIFTPLTWQHRKIFTNSSLYAVIWYVHPWISWGWWKSLQMLRISTELSREATRTHYAYSYRRDIKKG